MQSIYQLCDSVTNAFNSYFRFEMSSDDMNNHFNTFIKKAMYTDTGNLRRPKKDIQTLQQVGGQVRRILGDNLTVFGYWYKGEFYATGYKARELKEFKTTKELEKILPLQCFADNPEVTSGQYYISDIKKKFF